MTFNFELSRGWVSYDFKFMYDFFVYELYKKAGGYEVSPRTGSLF